MASPPTMHVVTQHSFGGPDVLVVAERPVPEPLPTEIRVRVAAAGINPVDWKTRTGGGVAGVLGQPPFVLGWDVAGVVDAVGRGVTRFAVGDEVYGMPWFPREAGAYGEYVTAPSRQFARRPARVSLQEAAALPLAALTAWQALVDTAHLGPGQRVLVHAAAGGVGHLAVQIAKVRGGYVWAPPVPASTPRCASSAWTKRSTAARAHRVGEAGRISARACSRLAPAREATREGPRDEQARRRRRADATRWSRRPPDLQPWAF